MNIEAIRQALLKLHAAGPDGFEGLIRDAFQEAVGITLRLMKSGPQGGVDKVSSFHSEIFSVGVEAKRYQETSTLKLDDLKQKLLDAATRTGTPIEVWILVASRSISPNHVSALEDLGDREGVSVLVLDWNSGRDKTPFSPLPLLLSLAPGAVKGHLGDDIARQTAGIKLVEGYELASQSLINKLERPDLGFTCARIQVREKIAAALASRADSKVRFKTAVDMLDKERRWVQRDGLCSQIDAWASSALATPVCAVIGGEGAGKTWLMFNWWDRFSLHETSPLVLWISARDIASLDLRGVLCLAFNKWFPDRGVEFWARRVQQWLRVHTNAMNTPLIYLMIDGVNEGDTDQTTLDILAQAVSSEWRGKVAILLSDRPDHWSRRMSEGASLETSANKITVNAFSDLEFNSLLQSYGKLQAHFSADVLALIRWPAWFQVAAELFDQPGDWSAQSPEQLMVRYWARRLNDSGRIASVDPDMFQGFLRNIGRQIAADWDLELGVKRNRIKEFLCSDADADEKGLRDAVSNIIDGKWLCQIKPHEFTVDPLVLPYAAALALLEVIECATTDEEADAGCEKFLGPVEERDIGVAVLRSAVALEYMKDRSSNSHVRIALTKRWILARNFRNRDLDLLWRIGLSKVDEFLLIAEDLWRETPGSHTDAILINSLAGIAGQPDGLSQVIAFLEKWASTYWLDPKEGQFISYRPSADEQAEARQATQARFSELKRHDPALVRSLRREEDGKFASWISHRAWAVSSYLPRAQQERVYRAWVLSRTVMGSANDYGAMSWTLRLNSLDAIEAEKVILSLAEEFQKSKNSLIDDASEWLLDGLGSPAAIAQRRPLATCSVLWQCEEDFTIDAESGLIQFKENSKKETHLLHQLSAFAPNLHFRIDSEVEQRLIDFADTFSVEELSQGLGQTRADIDLERTEPALARWTSHALVALYRRYLASISNLDGQSLTGYGLRLNRMAILLQASVQNEIEQCLVERIAQSNPGELDQTSYEFWAASLFGRTAAEQQAVWRNNGAPNVVRESLKLILACPNIAEVTQLAPYLTGDVDAKKQASWAAYLVCTGAADIPEAWEPVVRLFRNVDANMRYFAIQIALKSKQSSLAKLFMETGWEASKDRSWKENLVGSQLLVENATLDNFQEIALRIDPQVAGDLWQHLKYDEKAVAPFQNFLLNSIRRELDPPPQRSYPEYSHLPNEEALKRLLRLGNEEISRMVTQLFENAGLVFITAGEWPRLNLLKIFFETDQEFAVRHWTIFRNKLKSNSSRHEGVDSLVFSALSSGPVDQCRQILLYEICDDWGMLGLASLVNQFECVDWAITWIKEALANKNLIPSGEVARAIVLAGLLDDSTEVRKLWTVELNSSPCEGWLRKVYFDAKARAERGWNTLFWLQSAMDAKSDTDFFAAWRLFQSGIDLRLLPLARHRLEEFLVSANLVSTNFRRHSFIHTNYADLIRRSEEEKSSLQSTLFFHKKGFSQASPWAG